MPRARNAVALLLFATTTAAAPLDDVQRLLAEGDAGAAYALGNEHAEMLGQPAFDRVFGIAAIDAGHPGDGVLALERYLIEFPDDEAARLELAAGYAALRHYGRAREELENVLRLRPPQPLQHLIERQLTALAAQESPPHTQVNGFVATSFGFDNNAGAGSRQGVLELPVLGQVRLMPDAVATGDTFTGLAGAVNLRRPLASRWSAFGSAGLDGRYFGNDRIFSRSDLALGAGAAYTRGVDEWRARLDYQRVVVQDDKFRADSGFGVEWQRSFTDFEALGVGLSSTRLAHGGGNASRDALLTGGGLHYRRALLKPLRPVLQVAANIAQEENRRGHDDQSRLIYAVSVSVAVSPAPQWQVGTGLSMQESRFDDADQQLRKKREDDYTSVDLSASYHLNRNLAISGSLSFIENQSNISLFSYDQDRVAFRLRYAFH